MMCNDMRIVKIRRIQYHYSLTINVLQMIPNWLTMIGAALVPLIIGAVWYNPKVLGTAWMNASGVTEEKMKGANMGVIFGLTLLFSFFISLALYSLVIHQSHVYSILAAEASANDPASELGKWLADFENRFGSYYRTFKHGALHGTIAGILFALPVLSVNALFERQGFKYIAINAGYWIICLALMGGIVCQWG